MANSCMHKPLVEYIVAYTVVHLIMLECTRWVIIPLCYCWAMLEMGSTSEREYGVICPFHESSKCIIAKYELLIKLLSRSFRQRMKIVNTRISSSLAHSLHNTRQQVSWTAWGLGTSA